MTITPIPWWACSQWGQYEHDWLGCPACLTAYELYLEVEPMSAEADGTVGGMKPKFAVGQPVFVLIHNRPEMRRGTVNGSFAHAGEVHYTVLRRDGHVNRYAEQDLADADAGFLLAELDLGAGPPGPGAGKYGTLAALAAKLHPGEPWFAFRSTDRFAPAAVADYGHRLAAEPGLIAAAEDVWRFSARMMRWQAENPDKVKTPD